MEMTELIELIYWMLVIYGGFMVIAFAVAIVVIMVGFKKVLNQKIHLNFDEISKVYSNPNPARTISRFRKDTE